MHSTEGVDVTKNAVRFNVDLTINQGKLDAFQAIAQAMILASRKEPGTLGYDWYLSPDRSRCRLIETYADENAVQAHINGPAVQELVPKLIETSSITRFEVYGYPGPKPAEILANLGAEIFPLWQAFEAD
jgi:quinol monooxygenase YgiN